MSDQPGRHVLAGLVAIGLAHDLRNLLSVAETSAFLAATAVDGDQREKAKKHVGRIADVVREAQSLLTATLAMSRGEAVTTAAVVVAELVEAAVRLAGDGEKPIVVAPIEATLVARASRPLVTAALVNVLRNAREAANTEVRVTATEEAGQVAISIEDDGPGFPEGFAIATGRTTKAGGHGLGLATAQAALEAMGGWIAPSNGARGARVTIRLQRG